MNDSQNFNKKRFKQTLADEKCPVDAMAELHLLEQKQSLPKKEKKFGKYKIIKEQGQGGMGKVYLAYDDKLKRNVALKAILKSNQESFITRFLKEAKTLARLSHPNIVKIHDMGDEDGTYYFTMDFIVGKDLHQWIADEHINIRRILEVMRKVAQAIDYSHREGILHRDLKPANIMIDEKQEPIVMDFGLVREIEGNTNISQSGAIIGTPSYMPPEQALGKLKEIDERSDVYSLGAVLYTLLTGKPPFKGGNVHGIILQVVETDPVPPRQIARRVPREVESICLKALAKEQSHRYQSAQELALDLERFLNGEPIVAETRGWTYKLIKWTLRNRIVASIIFCFILVLLSLGMFYYWQINNEVAKTKKALQQTIIATANMKEAKKEEERAKVEATERLVYSYLETADHLWKQGERQHACLLYAKAISEEKNVSAQLKRFARLKLAMNFPKMPHVCYISGQKYHIPPLVFSPDGRFLAFVGLLNTIYLWDMYKNKIHTMLDGHSDIYSLAFSPNSRLLAWVGTDFTLQIWDINAQENIVSEVNFASPIAFSPDGKYLAVGSPDHTVLRLWDIHSKKVVAIRKEPYKVTAVMFSPDGKYLASGNGTVIKLWNYTLSKSFVLRGHRNNIWELAFSPNGKYLASTSNDKTVRLWDIENLQTIITFRQKPVVYSRIAFSPDSQMIAMANDHNISLGNLQSGKIVATFPTQHPTTAIDWNSDGKTLAWGNWNRRVNVKNLQENQIKHIYIGHMGSISATAFSPNNKVFASAGADQIIYLWDKDTRRLTTTLVGHRGAIWDLAFNNSGTLLASASSDKTIHLWDVKKRQSTILRGHLDRVTAVAFSPDDTLLLSSSFDKTVRLWDIATQKNDVVLKKKKQKMIDVAFEASGNFLVSASKSNVYLHKINKEITKIKSTLLFKKRKGITAIAVGSKNDIIVSEAGQLLLQHSIGNIAYSLQNHLQSTTCVAFSFDGKTIASGSKDKTVRVWNRKGNAQMILRGPQNAISSIAFSKNNRTLVSSTSNSIQLWEIHKAAKTERNHSKRVSSMAFAPDGKTFVSGSHDKTVCIWDAKNKKVLLKKKLKSALKIVAVSADSKMIAIACYKGRMTLYKNKQWHSLPNTSVNTNALRFTANALVSFEKNRQLYFQDINSFASSLEQLPTNIVAAYVACISPDTFSIAFEAYGSYLQVWDRRIKKMKYLKGHFDKVTSIVFHPNGKIFASASHSDIRLWKLGNKDIQEILRKHTYVNCLAFSPDGRFLASGSASKTVCLWDMETKRICSTLSGHSQSIRCLAFSPDGKTLASGDENGEIVFWDISGAPEFLNLPIDKIKKRVEQASGFRIEDNSLVPISKN